MPSRWILASLFLSAAFFAVVARQVLLLHAFGHPSTAPLPSDLLDGGSSAWVFVRDGCPHCAAHLAALRHSLESLPETRRWRVCGRLHVVGSASPGVAGIAVHPDSLRRTLGVRFTPCTWIVEADGRVRETWQGERNERAWSRVLAALSAAAASP